MLNNWIFWVILYLIFAVIFSQTFKKANRGMEDAGALTILLESFTALFALLFLPLFDFKVSNDINIYITLGIVMIIYAVTDRLNIEARYGLEPSTFSMLKQLSTVFLVILGIIFLGEDILLNQIIGGVLIITSNILLAVDKDGKFSFSKYFIMSFISNFLFAIAMLINVNISSEFNLALYTIFTVSVPAILIFIFGRYNFKKLKHEFKLYDKKKFLLASFSWTVMLISSVRAYQLESVSVVAPLLTLTVILNVIYEFLINKNRKTLITKLILGSLIVIGVILIKM